MIYLKCLLKKVKIKVNNFENIILNNKTEKIEEVIEKLKKGGVAIFPTDTVYGIGTLPNKKSVKKLYEIKNREYSKKIIALIDNVNRLDKLVNENTKNIKKIEKILNEYWPGELTIIFKANQNFTKNFDENMDTIGVRIPKSEIALKIIENLDGIVLTTSANLSGEKAVTQIKEINIKVLEEVDVVIGEINEKQLTGIPSTIIKYEDGQLTLIREGNISFEKIQKLMEG